VFVALVIQYAMRMHHIVVCGLSGPTIRIFPHYLCHKRQEFRKKELLTIKCVLVLPTNLSETLKTLRRIERDMIKYVCKY